MLAPLPVQYYALDNNQSLKEYVNVLQEKEWNTYQEELVEALSTVGTSLEAKKIIEKITRDKYFGIIPF